MISGQDNSHSVPRRKSHKNTYFQQINHIIMAINNTHNEMILEATNGGHNGEPALAEAGGQLQPLSNSAENLSSAEIDNDEMGVRHCFYDFCKQTILHGWHYLADIESHPTPSASFVTFAGTPAADNNSKIGSRSSSRSRSRSRSPNKHHHVTLNAKASGSGRANVSITHHHHCCSSCHHPGHGHTGQILSDEVVIGAATTGAQFAEREHSPKQNNQILCCCWTLPQEEQPQLNAIR